MEANNIGVGPDSAISSSMAIAIDNDLDKECSALGGLFQQIIHEMKAGIPNFEDFITKASKLHNTLKTTIVVLGSFLDSFQKIADSATNTKGSTRDIGTCLTRIVIRHRALESRMKSLNGALMDCLVLPIQTKLEEWRKTVHILDKDHAKEFKKYRVHIKKKSEQVVRLKKKMKKDSRSVPDPSVQRLVDQCLKDLNSQFRTLEHKEKAALRCALVEERNRFCTFAACMKPVVDEELGMLGELAQVEEVMSKLGKVTCNQGSLPESCEQVIEDVRSDNISLCMATPPSTPSSAMGSRKNSMCSISSIVSGVSSRNSSIMISNSSGPCSPTHSDRSHHGQTSKCSPGNHETLSLSGSVRLAKDHPHNPNHDSANRPGSAASAHVAIRADGSTSVLISNGGGNRVVRPHTISTSFERNGTHSRPPLSNGTFIPLASNSQPVSPSKQQTSPKAADSSLFEQSYSTIKRAYSNRGSPFRRPSPDVVGQMGAGVAKRPPLPNRCNSADGSSRAPGGFGPRGLSVERPPSQASVQSDNNNVRVIGFSSPKSQCSTGSPSHYAIPRSALKLQMVPDFHQGKMDMVIPQPVYMNTEELQPGSEFPEDDLKTPTVEELSFPGQKVTEDGTSSSSSGSIGSSSGYGSQNTIIKFDESQNLSSITLAGNHVNNRTGEVISPTPTSPHYSSSKGVGYPPSLAYLSQGGTTNPPAGTWTPSRTSTEHIFSTLLGMNRRSNALSLRRSDSFTPGMNPSMPRSVANIQRSASQISKPIPPIRRTPAMASPTPQGHDQLNNNHFSRTSSFQNKNLEPLDPTDDDATPHGSVENISRDIGGLEEMAAQASNVAESLRRIQNSPSMLRRSTSMSSNGELPPPCSTFERNQCARRSLSLAAQGGNLNKAVSFAPNPPTLHPKYNDNLYKKVGTHHVIPVSSDKPSPEGEIYGFGVKFKENSRHYFNHDPRHPISNGPGTIVTSFPAGVNANQETIQNQLFLDSLSAKLSGSVQSGQRLANGSRIPVIKPPVASHPEGNLKSKLHEEIQNGALNLKKTPNINDRSAPKL